MVLSSKAQTTNVNSCMTNYRSQLPQPQSPPTNERLDTETSGTAIVGIISKSKQYEPVLKSRRSYRNKEKMSTKQLDS